jgi:hypothetical protein
MEREKARTRAARWGASARMGTTERLEWAGATAMFRKRARWAWDASCVDVRARGVRDVFGKFSQMAPMISDGRVSRVAILVGRMERRRTRTRRTGEGGEAQSSSGSFEFL